MFTSGGGGCTADVIMSKQKLPRLPDCKHADLQKTLTQKISILTLSEPASAPTPSVPASYAGAKA